MRKNPASNAAGLTLVETMITLSIATISLLGVLELVNLSRRSTRNVTINSDWNALVSNLRLLLGQQSTCQGVLANGQRMFTSPVSKQLVGTAPGSPGTFTPSLMSTGLTGPGGVTVLGVAANSYPTFRMGTAAGNWQDGVTASVSGQSIVSQTFPNINSGSPADYRRYVVSLNLAATKLGNAASGTSGTALGGDILATSRGLGIGLIIVTGPFRDTASGSTAGFTNTADVISDCTATADLCQQLGGFVPQNVQPGDTQCVIPRIQYFGGPNDSNTMYNVSEPGEDVGGGQGMAGERIQLYGGGFGKPQPDDYAIGMGPQKMWFNIGGYGTDHWSAIPGNFVDEFSWNSRPSNVTDRGNELMSLDAGANLILDPEDRQAYRYQSVTPVRIGFGLGYGQKGAPEAHSSEYISSSRPDSPTTKTYPADVMDLKLATEDRTRLDIYHDGQVVLEQNDYGTSAIKFGPEKTSQPGLISGPNTGGISGEWIESCRGLSLSTTSVTCQNLDGVNLVQGNKPRIAIQGYAPATQLYAAGVTTTAAGSTLILPADDGVSRVALIGAGQFSTNGADTALYNAPQLGFTSNPLAGPVTGSLMVSNGGNLAMTIDSTGSITVTNDGTLRDGKAAMKILGTLEVDGKAGVVVQNGGIAVKTTVYSNYGTGGNVPFGCVPVTQQPVTRDNGSSISTFSCPAQYQIALSVGAHCQPACGLEYVRPTNVNTWEAQCTGPSQCNGPDTGYAMCCNL